MNYVGGSIWRKWDFHIHTPYSILNNGFGFNPYEKVDPNELEQKFDEYVKELFMRAIDADVFAIGITDYFAIDGYSMVVEKYLHNPIKMEMLFPDATIRERINNIYVFPNIELRLDNFIGSEKKSINYHVLFSTDVSIQEIKDNFLGALKFYSDADDSMSLTQSNIESFGRQIKQNNHETGSDLLVGLKHVTVPYNNILDVLKHFAGKYIISVPVDEDLSKVSWSGRDYNTRKNIYQQSHCYMTANAATIKWALAENEEEDRKREFGSIKPCIWGSDAHSYEKMFQPDHNRFCWIKADPTFEGLLQILYEPGERVAIQNNCPSERDIHQIIRSLTIEDPNFQVEPIVFNEALTCIIGGKSTGKSVLLEQLARSIDSRLVENQLKGLDLRGSHKRFYVAKTTVNWADGTSEPRKIVYIPQTYLNRTIDLPEENTAINKIIEDVLLQEKEIKDAHVKLTEAIERIKKQLSVDISEYCISLKNLKSLREQIKEHGGCEVFNSTINSLEKERSELASKIEIKQEEIERYAKLELSIATYQINQARLISEQSKLETMFDPKVIIPKWFSCINETTIEHKFGDEFPTVKDDLSQAISDLEVLITPKWQIDKIKMIHKIIEKQQYISNELIVLQKEYNELKAKVEQSERLQNLSRRIREERQKVKYAEELTEKEKKCLEKLDQLRHNIIQSRDAFAMAYEEYCRFVEETGTQRSTDLKFEAHVVWRMQDFQQSLNEIFDRRNFSTFKANSNYDLNNLVEDNYNTVFLEKIWNAMMMDSFETGCLTMKISYTLEKALNEIFNDWYIVHYIVVSGNDKIEEMSPGKKALVLLEMLISLEDSKCPILIDQPEDDLDNRSIYDDLVQFIRRKKKERQIIVVTHNANVALGADAEEVIIANQDGKNTENVARRFEYRSGAIENDSIVSDETGAVLKGILNQKGFQTQICDILEGGRLAFELRQSKYTSTLN